MSYSGLRAAQVPGPLGLSIAPLPLSNSCSKTQQQHFSAASWIVTPGEVLQLLQKSLPGL